MTAWGGGPGDHPDGGQLAFGGAPRFQPTGTDELIAGLTPSQEASVVHRGGPLLIVAGAGSGKTRVLTRRIAHLIATGDDQERSTPVDHGGLLGGRQAGHELVGAGRLVPGGRVEGEAAVVGVVARAPAPRGHSHSMVPGGLDVMSSATRLTPSTSLMMRELRRSRRSYGRRAQSAVMASSLVTARITIG